VEREAHAIATASRRMMWLFLDLAAPQPKEDPTDPTTKGYYYYRSALVAATAAADIDAADALSDPDRLDEESLFAANLGFHGKVVTPEQAERVNAIINPPRAGQRPAEPKGSAADAFKARWINSVERALAILELYATADQERHLGAALTPTPSPASARWWMRRRPASTTGSCSGRSRPSSSPTPMWPGIG
jgi:hypothetical protein